MTFTDDNLKRLKETIHMTYVGGLKTPSFPLHRDELESMIARLEAAEAVAGYMAPKVNDVTGQHLIYEWRKAAGK